MLVVMRISLMGIGLCRPPHTALQLVAFAMTPYCSRVSPLGAERGDDDDDHNGDEGNVQPTATSASADGVCGKAANIWLLPNRAALGPPGQDDLL